MRWTMALALILSVGLATKLTTAGATPGREVGDDEAALVIGGACGTPQAGTCGGGSCTTAACTVTGGVAQCTLICNACNSNCSIYSGSNGACNGSAVSSIVAPQLD